jgi:hypothetical protein
MKKVLMLSALMFAMVGISMAQTHHKKHRGHHKLHHHHPKHHHIKKKA